MNQRAEMLAQRREQLLAHSAAQRADLAMQVRSMNHSLGAAEVALRILGRIRRHPEWVVAALLGLAMIKPHRLSALFRFGTQGIRNWRVLAPVVMAVLAKRG